MLSQCRAATDNKVESLSLIYSRVKLAGGHIPYNYTICLEGRREIPDARNYFFCSVLRASASSFRLAASTFG